MQPRSSSVVAAEPELAALLLEAEEEIAEEIVATTALLEIEIHDLLHVVGLTSRHYLYIIGASCLGAIGSVIFTFHVAPRFLSSLTVVLELSNPGRLTPLPKMGLPFPETSWDIGLTTVFADRIRQIGIIICAPLADLFGRRPIVMVSSIVCALCAIFASFFLKETQPIGLVAFIFIAGFGFFINGWHTNAQILQMENVDRRDSIVPVSLITAFSSLIGLAAWFFILFAEENQIISYDSLRTEYLVATLLSLAAVGFFMIVKTESPQFLLASNQHDDARNAVKQLTNKPPTGLDNCKILLPEHESTSRKKPIVRVWNCMTSTNHSQPRRIAALLAIWSLQYVCNVTIRAWNTIVATKTRKVERVDFWTHVIIDIGTFPAACFAKQMLKRQKLELHFCPPIGAITYMAGIAAFISGLTMLQWSLMAADSDIGDDLANSWTLAILGVCVHTAAATLKSITFTITALLCVVTIRATTFAICLFASEIVWTICIQLMEHVHIASFHHPSATHIPQENFVSVIPIIWTICFTLIALIAPALDGPQLLGFVRD